VVDSEDMPLNISRQTLQDNALVVKLRKVLTKRFLKFLGEEAKKDGEKYLQFWKTFGIFLKEGVTSDFEFRDELAKLLRFESSVSKEGEMISLAEYVKRMQEGQEEIYYINGPSRAALEGGPYVEMFRKRNIEILYTLEPIDDFVLNHLGNYDDKKLVSADRADLRLPEAAGEDKAETEAEQGDALEQEKLDNLCNWMELILGDSINEVSGSTRLVDSPAIIVNTDGFMTSSMERIMQASAQVGDAPVMAGKKNMEINPRSPLIKKLAVLQEKDEPLAKDMAQQICGNAMIQAGLLVDFQEMVNRSFRIMERLGD
jgi:molecular chaperone HtpG